MRILSKNKDGGLESNATAYWLIEWKSLFSIALLKFEGKSREAFHTHTFNSISRLLKGKLKEEFLVCYTNTKIYKPSFKPIITTKNIFHKVSSNNISWVLTFRGPWDSKWKENTNEEGTYELTNGRKRI